MIILHFHLQPQFKNELFHILRINSETVGHIDLRLGEIVYKSVFCNISFSWLLPLDGFKFIFLCRVYWQWKRLIIRSKFFFLFIGREPTKWPANNCLQIMVYLCAMPSNCVWLQIIFCAFVQETVLFSFLRSLLRENCRSLCFPTIFITKQTRWSNDKTIIELGYRKISWFVSVSQINYLPKPNLLICSPQTNHDILLNNC